MDKLQDNQKGLEMKTDTPVTVTLTAVEWSSILYGIDELPRKTAQPLHDKINGALMQAALAAQPKEKKKEIKEK